MSPFLLPLDCNSTPRPVKQQRAQFEGKRTSALLQLAPH
jgi:hypothetical protein